MKILGYISIVIGFSFLLLGGFKISTTIFLLAMIFMFIGFALISPKKAATTGGVIAAIVGLFLIFNKQSKTFSKNSGSSQSGGNNPPRVVFENPNIAITSLNQTGEKTWEVKFLDRAEETNQQISRSFSRGQSDFHQSTSGYEYRVFWD